MKKLVFTTFLMIIFAFSAKAQVTIGDGKEPLDVSVLEVISSDSSQPKGLRLPQLTGDEVDILASYINQLPADEKIRSNGMMVFNTSISCTMVWNGKEFKSLCGDVSPAEITPDCSNLVVYPATGEEPKYQQGKPIDGSNSYITLPVTVTKSGTYKLIATTGNGYSFATDGTFLDVGNYVMKLTGAGTPITGNDNPQYFDKLSLSINGEDMAVITGCTPDNLPTIPVAPATGRATFQITCESSTVAGTYIVNTGLNSSHYIDVQVNVTTPGYYSFIADAAGMQFSRSGQWAAGETGTQTVRLLSSGTPTQAGAVPITITGEGANSTTCQKNITVSYRAIKLLGFGTGVYQPGSSGATNSARAIPASSANFGTSGTFPTQGISYANGGSGRVAAAITSNNPDIIVIGYNYHTNAADNTALVNFLASGGVVIAFTQDSPTADAAMINAICSSSITISSSGGGGSMYQFADIDNPILKGPFGDIRNQYWGEDAGTTSHISAVPTGGTQLAGNTAFMYKNFVWVGDGGFIAGNRTDTSHTAYPCKFDTSGKPVPKAYGSPSKDVYNGHFYANALAWAIDYVQQHKK